MKNRQDNVKDIAVIGGGASGLMCAATLADLGADAILFEKNESQKKYEADAPFDNAYLGKKLLITGKGRCNFTNDCDLEAFMKNVPRNPKFLFAAFSCFPPQKVMGFFENAGVNVKVERGNRAFPSSDRSQDILNALKQEIKNRITVKCDAVTDISKDGDAFLIKVASGNEYLSQKVIICTGGLSYSSTGSDGDGYRFAEKFGHTVTPTAPALVPLCAKQYFCMRMQGLSLKNVGLTLFCGGKKLYREIGEMLFTHFGISGPMVLTASSLIESTDDCYVEIDMKPGLDEKKLDERLLSDFSKYANRDIVNALRDLLPSSFIPVFVGECSLPLGIKPNAITKEQRAQMVRTLKHFRIDIKEKCGFDEAIITRGGVDVRQINPSTMESRKTEGLYFAGEVLDADGFTGGFNLQIAFSTARLAAISAMKKERK